MPVSITSPLWLAIMLGTIAVYWLLPVWLRHKFLIGATAFFMLLVDYRALILVMTFVVSTQLLLTFRYRLSTIVALLIPVLVLAYYKFQSNADPLSTIQGVAIPLGLSFTVFRVLHYVIERSRNNLPAHGFADYMAYIFFLPTILVGPINRFPQFVHDRRDGRWTAAQMSGGLERILIGYFKVVVIGNTVLSGVARQWVHEVSAHSPTLSYYLEAVVDSLNLYFQFSGFSDVAIGFALMLGYRVMENFRFPFLQTNIADFWRCWHISLTSWSREYIFMSVLSITRRPYVAVMFSLLFIGIWHELSFRYLAWGIYHGAGIIAYMQWVKLKRKAKIPAFNNHLLARMSHIFSVFLTANYFFFGFILTSRESLTESLSVMRMVLTAGIL